MKTLSLRDAIWSNSTTMMPSKHQTDRKSCLVAPDQTRMMKLQYETQVVSLSALTFHNFCQISLFIDISGKGASCMICIYIIDIKH